MLNRLFLTLALLCCADLANAVRAGEPGPAFRGLDLVGGGVVEYPALLQGKPAVVLFWATWCPYCKAFMPYAGQIQADYADHGVQILSLNHKERGRGDPAAYAQSLGFPLIAVGNADAIGDQWNIDFIPGLLVVAGDGTVAYRRLSTELPAGKTVAEQWDSEVRAVLDLLLETTPSVID